MTSLQRCAAGFLALIFCGTISFAKAKPEGPTQYFKKPASWFAGDEGKAVTDNILSHQSPEGSWPKNIDTTAVRYTGKPGDLKGTFDNGTTTDELRYLAKAYQATKDERCRQGFVKGLEHILKAQYPTGGWPQYYPPSKQYHRHITFNDDAMVRLMIFLRETTKLPVYDFLDARQREAATKSFDRGVECILKCQIKVDGKLTAWCAQHDEIDYKPRPARKYELASISGAESVRIVELLMSLERPSPQVVQAIDSAVAWFESAKIKGIRVDVVDDPQSPKGKDRRVIEDPAAPGLWARFYEIGSNKPIFCDRDGVAKHNLAEIGYERRNGYSWLGTWPQKLLEKEYPAWKAKQAAPAATQP